NVQYIFESGQMGLVEKKEKDESAERIEYCDPQTGKTVFFKRTDYKDQIYSTEEAKDQAMIREVKRINEMGRPILVGTTSVEHSEKIHRVLQKEGIQHAVLNAKI